MLIIGIDDAGRGPLIGPMIMAGVLIDSEKQATLKALGAKDSKLLSQLQRETIGKAIRKEILKEHTVIAEPSEIDDFVLGGLNLNTLEAKKMAEIINALNDKKSKTKVIVDCPSINTDSWKATLMKFIDHSSNLEVLCEHKADFNYPVVSAASILAKVRREEAVSAIKKQYGEIGSGYPADPITQTFLKERGKELEHSGIFRKSWSTWQTLFGQKKKTAQKKLF